MSSFRVPWTRRYASGTPTRKLSSTACHVCLFSTPFNLSHLFFTYLILFYVLQAPKEVLTVAINEDETILASACDTDIYIW